MAMEMKGRALTRDRLQPMVWRLTSVSIYGENTKMIQKKSTTGAFGFRMVLGQVIFHVSHLYRFSGKGLVRSVYMGRVSFRLFSQGNGEIVF